MPIFIAVVLSACGNSYSSAPGKIAATVNGEAIAVRQITPQPRPGAAAVEALDRLIDRELLAQKAEEKRLDQDPAVVREIEAAKRKILAQTYVDRSVPKQRVNPDEIVAFYRQNPALFEQRRSYRLEELVTTVSPEHLAPFLAKVAGSSRLDGLEGWLLNRDLRYRRIDSIKFSDQLPTDVLLRLATLKNGQPAIFETPGQPNSLSVILVLQTQDAPLSLEEAKPLIADRLLEQKREAFARNKAKQLRESARIEYLGAFAEAKNSASPARAEQQPTPRANANQLLKAPSGVL